MVIRKYTSNLKLIKCTQLIKRSFLQMATRNHDSINGAELLNSSYVDGEGRRGFLQ